MKGFVETSISRHIADGVAYSRDACATTSISGPPGIGKTFALQHIAERDRNAVYWSVPQARTTLKSALKAILDAFGYNIYRREHTDRLWDILEDMLPGEARLGYYLIVDEAQRLDLNILVEIVDFPARFGLPVIIAGNSELLKRTRSHGAAFDQIASRCAKNVILRRPLAEDILSIAVDFDVYGEDAREAAIAYGLRTSIRELVFMLKTARGLAERGPVRLPEIKSAAVFHKGGTDALALLKPAA